MGLFRRKTTQPAPPVVVSSLEHRLKCSGEDARKFSVTPDETAFFSALEAALDGQSYTATRMADGTISVSTHRAYLGKIKLQGRKTRMQYMTSLYNTKSVEDAPLEEYIQHLTYWVKSSKRRA